jgi:polar amino acid transport system permease protein
VSLNDLAGFFSYYNLVFLLHAALDTLLLAACGCVIGFVLGFGLAVLRQTRSPALLPARVAAGAYVQAFQRVPFLITQFLVFYLLQASRIDWPVFWIAAATIILIAAAYLSDVVRTGFLSVPVQEWQAAETMNLSLGQTLRFVVIPQAWRVIIPPTFTFFLSFIKDSALASQIGVLELTYSAQVLNNKGYSPVLSYGSSLVIYFLISYPIARFGRHMEKRLASSRTARR